MAQPDDPSNLLRPPFRRQSSEASPSSAYGTANGADPANPPEIRPDLNRPDPRRSQWRHYQTVYNQSASNQPAHSPQPEPAPVPSPPPRPALHLPQPKGRSPQAPPVSPPRQTAPKAHQQLRPQPPPVAKAAETQRPAPQPAPQTPAYRLGVRPPELQLKYLPRGAQSRRQPQPGAGRRSAPIDAAKVTPLPVSRSGSRSQPARGQAAQPQGSRKRERPTTPRKPAKPAPLPVLYGIRLLILGIGVAAIAGTLLSVLSPSNLSASDPDARANETARQSSGENPGVTIQAVPLGADLERLETEISELVTLTPGLEQTVFLLNLDSGEYVDLGGDTVIAAASTIKVPILVAFLQAVDRGEVRLDQALALSESQVGGGSGDMQFAPIGTRYSALDVANEMIINSDNTATNMIIDLLGGQDQLNQQFLSWGLTATVLRNPLPDLEGTNTTSARDLTLLMALVDRGGLLSLRSRDRLLATMQRTRSRRLIPSGVAEDAIVANKTGDIKSILADVALVDAPNGSRYVLSALVQRPDNDGRAGELLRRTAELVDKELNQPVAPVGSVAPTAPLPGAGESDMIDRSDIPVEDTPIEDMTIEPIPAESETPPTRSAPRPRGGLPQG